MLTLLSSICTGLVVQLLLKSGVCRLPGRFRKHQSHAFYVDFQLTYMRLILRPTQRRCITLSILIYTVWRVRIVYSVRLATSLITSTFVTDGTIKTIRYRGVSPEGEGKSAVAK